MARPRTGSSGKKGKGSSFGKRSDAEKSFRSRGRSSRSGRSDARTAPNPAWQPRGEKPSTFRGTGTSSGYRRKDEGDKAADAKTPLRRSQGGEFRPSGKPGVKPFGQRRDGDDRRDQKREGGSFRPRPGGKFSRPYRAEGDKGKRPFRNEGESEKRPYRAEGDQEKRPFRKSSPSFDRSEFKKTPRKTDGYAGATKPDREDKVLPADETKKPFPKRERKSFVQSRVVESTDFKKPSYKEEPAKGDGLTRLNKYIANSGVGSRREADELIKMGLITVNGITVTTLGTKVKPGDEVRYEDRVLKAEKPVYILLNKPKGFITTTDDPQERNTVMGLVASACKERIYPVGRLDRNTTGLLLLTNDGELADKLTHPSYKAKKVYKVELDRPLTKADFQKITEGVRLEEGRAMVDDLAIISEDDKTVGLEIHIGWNRVVRRIFESLGYTVLRLDRSVFAGLDKKDLTRGQWRFLKPEEVVRLKHFK